ncbi:hypothetical protein [Chryseobacterium sp. FH1]|uniref:hypothetical protein n=1 Tax=Chryseobacterium sp. FH1 TaxID=1233951 RepID=UPI000AAC9A38|nr:hypothetical protein [Chryseobacterium sp. FH1]
MFINYLLSENVFGTPNLQPDLSGNPFLTLEKQGKKDWERKADKLPKIFNY